MMRRRFFVGANWKCNGTLASVDDLAQTIYGKMEWDATAGDVIVAPTLLHILRVSSHLSNGVQVAAQNCSLTGIGAFTGEVAAEQLRDAKVDWVLVGHSERRSLFNDTDEIVAGKLKRLQDIGLHAVFCFGENLLERENDLTMDVVIKQLTSATAAITDWDKVVLAYEPVWAIGTGKVASPAMAQEVHAEIRKWLRGKVGADVASRVRIIYGGSVTPENSHDLITQEDIDGFLVGGASLKPGFVDIVKACEEEYKKPAVA